MHYNMLQEHFTDSQGVTRSSGYLSICYTKHYYIPL